MKSKYEVISILGEGSYGVVYKCKVKETNEFVAVKKFKDNKNNAINKSMIRELNSLKVLSNHKHIINFRESFKKKNSYYIVFDYMEKNLLEFMNHQPKGVKDSNLMKHIIYQIALGLKEIHGCNMLHRDIKPENILIDSKHQIKICDFGFARMLDTNNPDNLTDYVATRWYRAPELLLGIKSYGKEIDYWALGCIIGEMIDGNPLFPADSDLEQLLMILNICGKERFPEGFLNMFLKNYSKEEKEKLGEKVQKTKFINPNNSQEILVNMSLEKRYMGKICQNGIDLLRRLLHPNPHMRISLEEILKHPFFEQVSKPKEKEHISNSHCNNKINETKKTMKSFGNLENLNINLSKLMENSSKEENAYGTEKSAKATYIACNSERNACFSHNNNNNPASDKIHFITDQKEDTSYNTYNNININCNKIKSTNLDDPKKIFNNQNNKFNPIGDTNSNTRNFIITTSLNEKNEWENYYNDYTINDDSNIHTKNKNTSQLYLINNNISDLTTKTNSPTEGESDKNIIHYKIKNNNNNNNLNQLNISINPSNNNTNNNDMYIPSGNNICSMLKTDDENKILNIKKMKYFNKKFNEKQSLKGIPKNLLSYDCHQIHSKSINTKYSLADKNYVLKNLNLESYNGKAKENVYADQKAYELKLNIIEEMNASKENNIHTNLNEYYNVGNDLLAKNSISKIDLNKKFIAVNIGNKQPIALKNFRHAGSISNANINNNNNFNSEAGSSILANNHQLEEKNKIISNGNNNKDNNSTNTKEFLYISPYKGNKERENQGSSIKQL